MCQQDNSVGNGAQSPGCDSWGPKWCMDKTDSGELFFLSLSVTHRFLVKHCLFVPSTQISTCLVLSTGRRLYIRVVIGDHTSASNPFYLFFLGISMCMAAGSFCETPTFLGRDRKVAPVSSIWALIPCPQTQDILSISSPESQIVLFPVCSWC